MVDEQQIPLKDRPDFPIDTEDQAVQWMLELVVDVQGARFDCDVFYPGDKTRTVREQKRAERIWLVKHGGALGTVLALFRCGRLSQQAYDKMRKEILDTMVPTVVGVHRGGL